MPALPPRARARQRERGRDLAPRAGRRQPDRGPDAGRGRAGRGRGAPGHHRPAPAPRIRRRVRRLAGGVRADAAPAARQAAADRHRAAGDRGGVSRAASAACGASTRCSSSATGCSPASCAAICAAAVPRCGGRAQFRAELPSALRLARDEHLPRRAGDRRRRSGGRRLLPPHGAHSDRRQGAPRLDRGRNVAEEARAARHGLRVARQGAAAGALARQGADGPCLPSRRGGAGARRAGQAAIPACACPARSTASKWRCARSSASR